MSETPKRPGTVTFVGIVLFVFGTLSFLNSLGTGGIATFVAVSPVAADPNAKIGSLDILGTLVATQRFFKQEIPGYVAILFAFAGADLIFAVVQLKCGLGVMRLQPAARRATIALIVTKLVFSLGYQGYVAAQIVPAQARYYELHPVEVPGQGQQKLDVALPAAFGLWGGLCLETVLQIFIASMIVMLLMSENTKAAFAGTLEPPPGEEAKPASPYSGYDEQ